MLCNWRWCRNRDLGHYERFLDNPTSQSNNVTTGIIYKTVIEKERKGEFLGSTVQVIPHITDEIKERIKILGNSDEYDFVITEIGGTVGDIESLPFIEAVRQLNYELGTDSVTIHLTLVPYLAAAGELKTKPTQHSVKALLELGVQPDILVCRTERPLSKDLKSKIALFCNINQSSVIESIDTDSIYNVPLLMEQEGLDQEVLSKLKVTDNKKPVLNNWKNFLKQLKNPKDEVTIGLIGKYVELTDAYKSILESFVHAGAANQCEVIVKLIHSEEINEENAQEKLQNLEGILVAPGFGNRGIEGKILSIKYARENKIPFLGICLGMQCAVIEFARNVLNLEDAHSKEMHSRTNHPVIDIMPDQDNIDELGGTMRLGAYPCFIEEQDSLAFKIYQTHEVAERHRHRYEFNNKYRKDFENHGMIATGIYQEKDLVEIIELKDHPWFLGVQFHPEYKSTVSNPHPIFKAFVKAVKDNK